MIETIFPQSPNWFLNKIISTREDGSVAYGSQKNVFILKHQDNRIFPLVIQDAHSDRITSVVFSPTSNNVKIQNLVLSSSNDGFVKLWNVDTLNPVIGHNTHWSQKDSVKVVCADWNRSNPQYIVSAAENDTIVLWDILNNTTTRFFFDKLKPSVMECSLHNKQILAVGSRNGLVYIIKLIKKGEIIHVLRGHDKEIQALSWCPVPFNKMQENHISEQFYVASSCQGKEIFIWKSSNGECVSKIELPKNPFSKGTERQQYGKSDAAIEFIPLFWVSSYILYSGTKYGELICCDLELLLTSQLQNEKISGKQYKKMLNCWKLVHSFHSKGLLAISGIPVNGTCRSYSETNNTVVYDLPSSELHVGDLSSNESNSSNSIQKFDMDYSQTQSLIWTIGKDQALIAVHRNSAADQPVFNFHTINGHAFDIAVSPHDPNKVAIGVGDGKIRLWNASKSSNHVNVFWQKINDRVYSLAWHPFKEGLLAYGTSEGRVGIIDVYTRKPPLIFTSQHHGKVYSLSWGPPFLENEETLSAEGKELLLYSVGGSNVFCHNVSVLNTNPLKKNWNIPCKKFCDISWKPDFTLLALGSVKGYIYILKSPKLDVVSTVLACMNSIWSLAWHPAATTIDQDCSNFHGYLTFGSTDEESVIKVYNCIDEDNVQKMELVSALKGHSAHVCYVSWSPHVSGRLISAAKDLSVIIWDVTTNTQLLKLVISQVMVPSFCIWSPIDPDSVIIGYCERMALLWKTAASSTTDPIVKDHKVIKGGGIQMSEPTNKSEICTPENGKKVEGNNHNRQNEINDFTLAKSTEAGKPPKENKMFTRTWKSDADPFRNCYDLLKTDEPESDRNFILPFLNSENKLLDFLNVEAESYEKANSWNEHYQLALWRGNLKEIIEEKIATGHLDDFLISLTPFVSPRLWQQACLSYSKSLAEKKCYRKAACYLMAVHKVHEAIDLLVNADLFLEALSVVRCRLPNSDPVFLNVIRKYGDWLAKTGSLLRACECYIYLNDFSELIKVLGKKNKPEYLILAALASKRADLADLESDYSNRAILLCLEADKWGLASQICDDHPNLKQLSLLNTTYGLIYKLDAGELTLEKDLISHLNEVTGIKGDPEIYKSFRYTYDKNNFYSEKKQMFIILAHELSLACCSTEKDVFLSHIVRAMNAASRFLQTRKEDIPALYKLSSWLSPKGFLIHDSIFCWSGENIKKKIISLRAFLCLAVVYAMGRNTEIVAGSESERVNLLKQLMNDALDKETFIYFKNQLEIKSIEKRLSEAYKRKIQQNSNYLDEQLNDTMKGVECLTENLSNGELDEKLAEVSLDDIIASENGKRNQLNAEIKDFENSRVIAPNPALVFCELRQVLQVPQNSEEAPQVHPSAEEKTLEAIQIAKGELLIKVQEKWKELNQQ